MDDSLETLIDRLDTKKDREREDAWVVIRARGVALMPGFREAYPRFKKGEGRTALVFYATQYARVSDEAFELGKIALGDRSKSARDRACGLLAYSLRTDAIDILTTAMSDPDPSVSQSAKAAVTAIKAQNHHLFVDRSGSGRSFWVVNPEDRP